MCQPIATESIWNEIDDSTRALQKRWKVEGRETAGEGPDESEGAGMGDGRSAWCEGGRGGGASKNGKCR
jgi:hypothetical protein